MISTPLWKLRRGADPIILASASPRRVDLLRAIGLPFDTVPSNIEEGGYGPWDGGDKLRRRALDKAESVQRNYPSRAVLAADTIVLLDGEVLGKPMDREDARSMLERLSGRWHEVWTALCLLPAAPGNPRNALSRTRVLFRHLTPAEIQAYIETDEPLDKAGGYGIQGLGGLWVREIQGCYFNVVGLPLSQLWDLLPPKASEPSLTEDQP